VVLLRRAAVLAWRQGRSAAVADYIDKALVIFPFEENFYRERGVDATFVGHPLADLAQPGIGRNDYCGANFILRRKVFGSRSCLAAASRKCA